MRKLLVIAGLMLVGSGACSRDGSTDGDSRSLAAAAQRVLADGTPRTLRLQDVFNQIAWDRVLVFRPYTPPDELDRRLGFRWDSSRTGISELDSFSLVVFTKGNAVVRWFRLRSDVVKFDEDSNAVLGEGVEARSADFAVKAGERGVPVLTLKGRAP